MRFCSKFNATIAEIDLTKGTSFMTYNEKEKTFGGPIGLTMVNSIFLKRKSESQKFFFKYCKFVFTDQEGTFLSDGTFTGDQNSSIGLLINNKADLLLRPKSIFLNPDLIGYSKVMTSDDLFVAHYIYKNNITFTDIFNLNSAIDIFLMSSDLIILFFLLYFISFIIGLIIFRRISYFKKYNFNIFYSNFFEFRFELTKSISPLSFILIFNLFFMFLIRNFLANDINSKRVIVDKENLIYNKDKFYSIDLKACWAEKSYAFKIFKYSIKGSLENFIYFNKSLDAENPCIFYKDKLNVAKPTYPFFLFGLYHHIPLLEFLGSYYNKDIFFNQQIFFSYNSLYYFSKKIDPIVKREVIKWLDIYFEHSFKQKVYRDGYEVVRTTSAFTNTIYYDVEQYIKENTLIEGFNFTKFKDSFYLYMILLIFYTFVFLCLNIILIFKSKF